MQGSCLVLLLRAGSAAVGMLDCSDMTLQSPDGHLEAGQLLPGVCIKMLPRVNSAGSWLHACLWPEQLLQSEHGLQGAGAEHVWLGVQGRMRNNAAHLLQQQTPRVHAILVQPDDMGCKAPQALHHPPSGCLRSQDVLAQQQCHAQSEEEPCGQQRATSGTASTILSCIMDAAVNHDCVQTLMLASSDLGSPAIGETTPACA